jgi:glycerol-3-phosphate dehydrogenase
MAERAATIEQLSSATYDLLIVGGGITGAAIAREAARAGLRVALIEQGDYASGTSSRSSRLIHGGLRYLRDLRFGLVTASLREQAHLATVAPHLVRPMPFLLPMYRDSEPSPTAMRIGMRVYRALSPSHAAKAHRRLSAAETVLHEPLLAPDGLAGGLLHQEYVTHDSRLVVETILAAREGGAVTANYVSRVVSLTEKGRAIGAVAHDAISGGRFDIRARVVVNATGPWRETASSQGAGAPITLTKGAHVLLPDHRLPLQQAVAFLSPRDGRALFGVPQSGFVYLGTTETPYHGNPGDVVADGADVAYLVEAASAAFPSCGLSAADVAASWAGVRPLVSTRGRALGQLSRRYTMQWDADGVLTILGGKLTLHRRMARAALGAIARQGALGGFRPSTAHDMAPLPGAVWSTPPSEVTAALLQHGLSHVSAAHLTDTYGARAAAFVTLLRERPDWARRIAAPLPHVWAEVGFAMRHEMAVCADDFLRRRGDLALRLAAEGLDVPPSLNAWWPASAHDARASLPTAAHASA